MKRILAMLMLLSLLAGAFSLPALAEDEKITYTGTVTGGSLHLRREPDSSGKVIQTYKSGTQVEILENLQIPLTKPPSIDKIVLENKEEKNAILSRFLL